MFVCLLGVVLGLNGADSETIGDLDTASKFLSSHIFYHIPTSSMPVFLGSTVLQVFMLGRIKLSWWIHENKVVSNILLFISSWCNWSMKNMLYSERVCLLISASNLLGMFIALPFDTRAVHDLISFLKLVTRTVGWSGPMMMLQGNISYITNDLFVWWSYNVV